MPGHLKNQVYTAYDVSKTVVHRLAYVEVPWGGAVQMAEGLLIFVIEVSLE